MDLDTIFGNTDIINMDKASLTSTSKDYLDNLLTYVQLIYYTEQLEDKKMAKIVANKITPMFSILASEMEKMVNDYQNKHGEI